MKKIELDTSKLLGFRLGGTGAKVGSKKGVKTGRKAGQKIGVKR